MGPFLSPAHSSNSGVFVGSTKGLRESCKARLVLLGLGETACDPSNGLVPVWGRVGERRSWMMLRGGVRIKPVRINPEVLTGLRGAAGGIFGVLLLV